MTNSISDLPVGTLRQRMIEDMNLRRFTRKTQLDYVRHVKRFAAWLGRPPDTATAEDLRQFQVDQRDAGLGIPTMNSIVAALRFFFTHTIDRPDLSRKLYTVKNPRSLPIVLSPDEVMQLLGATTCLKHKAALSVAYGAGLRAAEVTRRHEFFEVSSFFKDRLAEQGCSPWTNPDRCYRQYSNLSCSSCCVPCKRLITVKL